MTDVVTPSASAKTLTKGQASKFVDVMVDALVKSALPSEPAQRVLEGQGPGLADEFVALVCKRVEAVSGLISRTVSVDRSRSPRKVLEDTGRNIYCSDEVVKRMPKGDGEEVEVYFFNIGRYTSDDDLEKEYDLRGLVPADPYSLAAVNQADPAFADEHPNATHWKDSNDDWCFAAFDRWDDGRGVGVYRSVHGWYDYWWFAGLRKK